MAGCDVLLAAIKNVWRPLHVCKHITLLNFMKSFSSFCICKEIAASFIVKHTRRVRNYSVMPNSAFGCSPEYRCLRVWEDCWARGGCRCRRLQCEEEVTDSVWAGGKKFFKFNLVMEVLLISPSQVFAVGNVENLVFIWPVFGSLACF